MGWVLNGLGFETFGAKLTVERYQVEGTEAYTSRMEKNPSPSVVWRPRRFMAAGSTGRREILATGVLVARWVFAAVLLFRSKILPPLDVPPDSLNALERHVAGRVAYPAVAALERGAAGRAGEAWPVWIGVEARLRGACGCPTSPRQGKNRPFRGPRGPSSTMNQPIRVKVAGRAEDSLRERTRRAR
jgi:hypothetical protein